MRPLTTIGILGAGAMGAYFAESFSKVPSFSTFLIAGGNRAEKLETEGLVINEQRRLFKILQPCKSEMKLDLILVALKHHQLQAALSELQSLVGANTVFLSVMNGLESEEIIASLFGKEKVLYAISVGIDAVREGNQITYTKPGKHIFGEAENSTLSEKVLWVQQAFRTAGIQFETPVDMLRMLWWKFMVNVGVNQASAVLRAPYGVFHENPDAQALMEALMREVVTLAQASNVNLTEGDIQGWYPVLRSLSAQGKTSMLQDVEAGRKTEVEVFGGKVVELGRTLGIPTPVNQTIVHIVNVIERANSNLPGSVE